MHCVYCGKSLTQEVAILDGGEYFCSALHRYLWRKAHAHIDESSSKQSKSRSPLARKVFFAFVYSLVMYVVMSAIGAFVAGEIAQHEADPWRITSPRLVEAAGYQFHSRYGWLIALCSLCIATAATIKGWLPGTTPRKPAMKIGG